MKIIFGLAVAVGLALSATAKADNAVFPEFMGEGAKGPTVSAYTRYTGKQLDPASNSTSIDSVDFGFTARAVRLCVQAGTTAPAIYVRFAASTTNDTSLLNAITAPASTPGAFQDGSAGTAQAHAAATLPIGGGDGTDLYCEVIPVLARGVTVHIASGLATIDAAGFR